MQSWLEFADGTLVNISNVVSIEQVEKSVVITYTTGLTRNLQYSSVAQATAQMDLIETAIDSFYGNLPVIIVEVQPAVISVISITPNSGAQADTTVTAVTGTLFDSGALITINGAPCATTFIDSQTLLVDVPPGVAGTYDVEYTGTAGNATLVAGWTYT